MNPFAAILTCFHYYFFSSLIGFSKCALELVMVAWPLLVILPNPVHKGVNTPRVKRVGHILGDELEALHAKLLLNSPLKAQQLC